MRKLTRFGGIFAILVLGAFVLAACGPNTATKQAKQDVATRESVYQKAVDQVPVPQVDSFPIRQALSDYTTRQSLENHPWFIYLLAATGEPIGYYVGKTYPINACDFLSSTENVVYDDHGNVVTTAPSLDGIFYGGAGATGGCGTMFFFDASTNAMETFDDPYWTASDSPSAAFQNVKYLGNGPAPTVTPSASPAATTTP